MYFSVGNLNIYIQYLTATIFVSGALCHPNWHLFDHDNCGNSYSDRIIGGTNASLGQYPWLARIGYIYYEGDNSPQYRCGGALINSMYVLTAAHCVTNLPSPLEVGRIRLGEYNALSDVDCNPEYCAPPVQDFKPAKIMFYTGYGNPPFKHDIGLIRLDRPANLNGFVMPICLPTPNIIQKDIVGSMAEVAGWGISNIVTKFHHPVLQYVKVPVVQVEECVQAFTNFTRVGKEQLCAGGIKDKDSCAGDSGGPLMKVEADGGPPKYYVIGMVSFGVKKCGMPVPAVYTKLAHYLDWVLDHVEP